jgi:hypothetical protein
MSLQLLGEGFDLHCGGADLRFPHHENERAQAVALGKTFAQHWMHNGFVVDTDGEKMSKSLGNVTNLVDLVQHYDPRAYRMLLLQTHYRSPVKVGQDNIDSSVKSLANLDGFADRMAKAELPAVSADTEVLAKFRELMDNDIDTPNAMAIIFDTVRRANIAIESGDTELCASLASAMRWASCCAVATILIQRLLIVHNNSMLLAWQKILQRLTPYVLNCKQPATWSRPPRLALACVAHDRDSKNCSRAFAARVLDHLVNCRSRHDRFWHGCANPRSLRRPIWCIWFSSRHVVRFVFTCPNDFCANPWSMV